MSEQSNRKRRSRSRRPSLGTILGGLALMVALGGVAQSAVPGPDGKIYACYLIDPDPDFSYIYIIDHDGSCQPGEVALQWSQDPVDGEEAANLDSIFEQLKNATAGFTPLLEKLGVDTKALKPPKAKGPNLGFLKKVFEKAQANKMRAVLKPFIGNDRKVARELKKQRDTAKTIQKALKQIELSQMSQEELNATLLRALRRTGGIQLSGDAP